MSGFSVGAGYSAEAVAFFNRLATAPVMARAQQYDLLIRALVNSGAWTCLDFIHVLAAADSITAKINLVSSSYALTEVNSPAFVADRGFTSDGSTSYLTGPNLSSFGGKYVLDSSHMGVFVGTTAVETLVDVGCATNFVRSKSAATTMSARANDGTTTALVISPATAIGHTVWNRAASTQYTVHKNGALIGTTVVTSTSITNATFGVCAQGNGASFSTKQISACHAGNGALTAAQIGVIASSLATYMQSVGAPTA